MKVAILNEEQLKDMFKNWGEFSCTCYNTPKKFAKKVGESCLSTKHFSGSRAEYIKFEISGVSRACIDQMIRAEQGVVKNVMSGRYVDFSNFEYHTPFVVAVDEELRKLYDKHMKETQKVYEKMVVRLNELGYKGEEAYEVARGVAPMNHCTSVTIGFTVEALINFMHKRLCKCSQQEIRQLAYLMKTKVVEILPELNGHLEPVCGYLGYCPEKPQRSCGMFPQKEVRDGIMLEYRNLVLQKGESND